VPVRADATKPPQAELLTIGPGGDLLSRFGHSVLCVFSTRTPEGLCFNYGGVRDGDNLARRVVFGDAAFALKTEPYDFMVEYYRQENRTVYRQVLPLDASQAVRLEAELLHDVERLGSYDYQPLNDNCTTRVRDRIDAAVGGVLRAAATPVELTYRQFVRDALSDRAMLLSGVDLVLGPDGDAPLSTWHAMASPDELRRVVTDVFGAEPAVLYRGMEPLSPAGPWSGRTAFLVVAIVLFALGLAASRTRSWARSCLLGMVGLVLASVALFATVVIAKSDVRQLWPNWVVLVCPPTDVVLLAPFVPRWSRVARWIRAYAIARAALAAAVAAMVTVGVISQPLLAICALGALGCAGIAMGASPAAVGADVENPAQLCVRREGGQTDDARGGQADQRGGGQTDH
jgi:hypothetical protein